MRWNAFESALRVLIVLLTCSGVHVALAGEVNYKGSLEQGDQTYEDSGEFFDTYTVKLIAGQFVDVYASSDAFDSYMIIVSPKGEQYDIDDYYIDDINAGLLFVARETGNYEIHVTSIAAGDTGAYELDVITQDTKLEKTHEGQLAEGDDISWKGGEYFDRYELTVKAGESRIVSLDSDDFSVYLGLHTSEGDTDYVFGRPAAKILEAFENDVTYTLVVTSDQPKEVGAYRLEVRVPLEDKADEADVNDGAPRAPRASLEAPR